MTANGPNSIAHGGLGVGINTDGNAAVVYASGANVFYVTMNSTGTVSAPVTFSTLPGSAYYLDAASTPQGLGLVGWNQDHRLWVSHRL